LVDGKGAKARDGSEGLIERAAIIKIGRAGRMATDAREADEKRARRDAILYEGRDVYSLENIEMGNVN
jgi:hypothetical protein